MIGHISKHKAIPTLKHHACIIFQEFFPKDKSFATPRASFDSKYVSDQIEMNLTKLRYFLSIIGPIRKTSFSFYIGIMVWEQCQNYKCHRRIAALLE